MPSAHPIQTPFPKTQASARLELDLSSQHQLSLRAQQFFFEANRTFSLFHPKYHKSQYQEDILALLEIVSIQGYSCSMVVYIVPYFGIVDTYSLYPYLNHLYFLRHQPAQHREP